MLWLPPQILYLVPNLYRDNCLISLSLLFRCSMAFFGGFQVFFRSFYQTRGYQLEFLREQLMLNGFWNCAFVGAAFFMFSIAFTGGFRWSYKKTGEHVPLLSPFHSLEIIIYFFS